MTTQFENVESAKNYACYFAEVDPKNTEFIEDPNLKLIDVSYELLNNPNVSEKRKKEIRDRISGQKVFHFKDKDGEEMSIVIGPFCGGFDLWFVSSNGWAWRV